MSEKSLTRAERLRSLSAIRRLFSEGRSGFTYPFRHLLLAEACGEGKEGSVSVMFSVPKKFHKRANKRNLLKRRSREAYRLNNASLKEVVRDKGVAVSIAFVLSTKDVASYKTIEYAVKRILEHVQESL